MEPEKYEAFIQSLKSEWQYWPCCVDQLVMLSWAHTEEKQLRHRIKELMRYRRNGITKLDGLLYFVCAPPIPCTHLIIEGPEFDLLPPHQDKAEEKQVCCLCAPPCVHVLRWLASPSEGHLQQRSAKLAKFTITKHTIPQMQSMTLRLPLGLVFSPCRRER